MNAGAVSVVIGSSTRWPLASLAAGWRVKIPAMLRWMLDTVTARRISPLRYRWWMTAMVFARGAKIGGAETPLQFDSVVSDWADVCASLGGDNEAYAQLVRRYQEPIAAYMRRFTRDQRQREELVHDVFVDAYLGLASYSRRAPLLHWLRRIATRVGYRFWKGRQRRRREVALPETAGQVVTDSNAMESARHAAEVVHCILAQLAPRDRLVMTLIYLESHSLAEVAQLTGWTQTMVKVQAHRARKRLAKICTQMGVEL